MNVGSVSDGPASVASLTRLVVAAQAAKQPQPESPVAVEALQLGNLTAIETGRLDTYA
jgi:hypothetical protein